MASLVGKLPLVLSILAIVLAGGLLAQAVTSQNTINSLNDKLNSVNGRVDTVQAPKTQEFSIEIGEGKIVNETSETPTDLQYHRFNPAVLVVNKGDTVKLTIMNRDHHIHSFEMAAFGLNIDSGRLMMDESATVTFVANQSGVFEFKCGVDYTPPPPPTEDCSPDHSTMVGYLVVLSS